MAKLMEEKVRAGFRRAGYTERKQSKTCKFCKFKKEVNFTGITEYRCLNFGLLIGRQYQVSEKNTCNRWEKSS